MPGLISPITSTATAESSWAPLPQHLDLVRILDHAQPLDDVLGGDNHAATGATLGTTGSLPPLVPPINERRVERLGQPICPLHGKMSALDAHAREAQLLEQAEQGFVVAPLHRHQSVRPAHQTRSPPARLRRQGTGNRQ